MIPSNFVYIAMLISFAGGLSYLRDTLLGRVQPNRVSWGIWALAPLVAFAAQVQKGIGTEALLTFTVGFNPLMVFVGSFVNRNARWEIQKLDIVCGLLSLVGIAMWAYLGEGNYAIIAGILADGLAAIPTIKKSYYFPETESYIPFAASATSSAITLLTIDTWKFANYGFPLYIFIICIVIGFLIVTKIGQRKKV